MDSLFRLDRQLDEEEEEAPPPTFEELYNIYSKLWDPDKDGSKICYTAVNRWLKSCKILDGKTVRETDVGVAFFKFKRRAISSEQFALFLQDLCEQKGLDIEDVKEKMLRIKDPREQMLKEEKSMAASALSASKSGSKSAALKSATSSEAASAAAAAAEEARTAYRRGTRQQSVIAGLRAQGIGLSKQELEDKARDAAAAKDKDQDKDKDKDKDKNKDDK